MQEEREREQLEGLMASSPAMKLSPPLYKTSLLMREKKEEGTEKRRKRREGELLLFLSFFLQSD